VSNTMLTQSHLLLAVIPNTGLLFGFMLAAAIVGGYVAHALRIPRMVGYLLAGIGLKLLLYQFLRIEPGGDDESRILAAAEPLKAIKDLGLGIILFSIGGVFESRHIRAVGRRIPKIALSETGLTFLLVFLGVGATAFASHSDGTATTILSFALLMGLGAMDTGSAATLFVLREYDAKGPVTDTVLTLTGLNNILCIVTFYLAFTLLAASGALGPMENTTRSFWIDALTLTLGSAALGIFLGFILSLLHAKLQPADTLLILIAILIVSGSAEGWLLNHHNVSYNFLLTSICMGGTFVNTAIDPDRLRNSLHVVSGPIMVGFFVMAGYELHLADVANLRWIGAAYVVCRILGKVFGAYLGARWSGAGGGLRPYLGTALLCQAAVTIGLADFVAEYWRQDWGRRFATVALGAVVIFEVTGPLLIKQCVKWAGEVKAITLLRRNRAAPVGTSILSLTAQALLRSVGLSRVTRSGDDRPLLAKDIMRTNVKCLAAGADFDEVLHFVENSRFNHFPVVDQDQQLIGVIHFSDIRGLIYDPFLSHLMTAADLASTDPRAVPAEMPAKEALSLFQDGDVGSMPVVQDADSRNVVGIIEQRDLLRALHRRDHSG